MLNVLLRFGEVSEHFENVDNDVMIQKLNVYPKPIVTEYGIKENDVLCGNIPFKSYVSIMLSVRLQYFFRTLKPYFFPANQANGNRGFQTISGPELILSNSAVQALTKWNIDRFRQSAIIDKIFIEYLIIILVGTVKIKAEDVGEEAINLIKGK